VGAQPSDVVSAASVVSVSAASAAGASVAVAAVVPELPQAHRANTMQRARISARYFFIGFPPVKICYWNMVYYISSPNYCQAALLTIVQILQHFFAGQKWLFCRNFHNSVNFFHIFDVDSLFIFTLKIFKFIEIDQLFPAYI
jgi:hypothetical protein